MEQSQIEQSATIESHGHVSTVKSGAITPLRKQNELPARIPPDATQRGIVVAFTKIEIGAIGEDLEIRPIWWATGDIVYQYTEYHLNGERIDADIQELAFTHEDVESFARQIQKTTKWKDVAAAVIGQYR